jgi:large subunit ribosomal protein L24
MSKVKNRIKVGMKVVLRAGYKAYRGKIFSVVDIQGEHVLLDDSFRKIKKFVKPTQENEMKNIIERTAPVHISNVAAYDEKAGTYDKITYKIEGDKKIRVFKKTGNVAS